MDLNQAIKFINCKHSEDLPVKEKDLFYNDQDENSYDDFIFVLSTLTQKTDLLEKVIAKKSLNNIWFLKKFSGKGTLKKPFSVETKFGNWLVYNAREFFEHKRYPKEFLMYHGYSNAYYFLCYFKDEGFDFSVLTGVAEYGNPFMFCGILFTREDGRQFVFDFDRDLVMDYELFCRIFRFNEMCRVDASTLEKDGVFKFEKITGDNLALLFTAYHDAIDKIKESPDVNIADNLINC